MGLFDGLLGGGAGSADDPYADILTPAQRNQMQVQGLLAMAGAFAQAGMPSRLPVPFGSALGSAAAALGTGQEAGMKTAIENALAAQKVRDLRAKAALQGKLSPIYQNILDRIRSGQGTDGTGVAPVPSAAPGLLGTGTSPGGTGASPGAAPSAAPPEGSPLVDLPYPDTNMGATGEYGTGQPASPVGRQANQTGTDYLGNLAQAAAPYALPPGYSVAMTSGERPGATVAGTGGRSQHADANAGDFVIKDDKGAPIPNKGEDTSGYYGRLAQTMRQLADPAVRQQLAWGGNFTTGGDNAPRDLMHFDLGGDRGRYGTLAAMEQSGGLLGPGQAVPNAAPQTGLLASAGGGPLTGSAWEAANNNLGGLRRPGMPAAGPSQGGFQTFGTPQEGVSAISRQLDRYASGATTGAPLTTLRQIVSTWAPPNENDTQALIQRASQVVGVHPDQPLDVSNPAVKAKLIEATIRNEQGGRLPVDPQLIQQAAALQPPDQVVPSGPGAGGNLPAATLAQYRPQGGAAVPGMPQLAAPSTLPPLAVPGGAPALGAGGKIPGLNMTPQELAVIDAMAESAGLGNPFKGLLDTYYKSPGYLQESAGATARGRIAEEEPSQLRIQAAKARGDLIQKLAESGLTLDQNNKPVVVPGMPEMLGLAPGAIEQAKQEAGAKLKIEDTRVIGPDGQPTIVPMPVYEKIWRLQQQAANTAMGAKPQPGDIIGTPALTPGQTTSQQQGATAGWKALEDTHAAELAANRRDQQLGQLAEAMQGFTPGATAEVRIKAQSILRDLGLIKGDEVPSAETFQRAARQLQITAAPKGQGSTSNYERELYAEAVPAIVNSPESLAKAVDIARRLDQYDRSVAQIHRDVASANGGTPNLIEAQRRIAALGPPLSPGEIGALEQIRAGKVPGPGQTATPNQTTAPAPGAIKTPYGTITPVQ